LFERHHTLLSLFADLQLDDASAAILTSLVLANPQLVALSLQGTRCLISNAIVFFLLVKRFYSGYYETFGRFCGHSSSFKV
jgi:hypothetical protein